MARRLQGVPGQWTTDPNAVPDLEGISALQERVDAALARVDNAAGFAVRRYGESEASRLIIEIKDRKSSVESEQARMAMLFRRWDNLYFPGAITSGGPDHWPEGVRPGRNHVSVNTPPVYVDVPAALQAVEPIENYVPEDNSPEKRDQAARAERLYFQWKDEEDFETKGHKACTVKGLYGHTFGKVHWDSREERPVATVIESPENLYVGWGASDYSRVDWAIYCYGLSEQAIKEDFGLSVGFEKRGEAYFPYVVSGTHDDPINNVYGRTQENANRSRPEYEMGQIEVYDYWYKKPVGKGKKPTVWNCIFVGNEMVKNQRHPEYDDIPYVPLPNTFIPGFPYGKPELYDIEQLLREKDERITNAGQMIQSITEGQRWQLVGPEAPDEVPPQAVPQPNKVAAPGPGAEIKAIQPFVAEYAVADYLKQLDEELARVSGLNPLLLGEAPPQVLGSSKAIAALVANYESRITMKRRLYYAWRKRMWAMAAKVWESKSAEVKKIIAGNYRLEVKPPELTPHDSLEVGQLAMSLVQNRLWSMERAMDATGVEDPAGEKNVIREEQTDPALNPAAVQAQVTLVGALQAYGINPAQVGVPGAEQAANADRTLNRPTPGSQSLNQPENQANSPNPPANAQAPNGAKALNQSLVQNGEATGRLLTQSPVT